MQMEAVIDVMEVQLEEQLLMSVCVFMLKKMLCWNVVEKEGEQKVQSSTVIRECEESSADGRSDLTPLFLSFRCPCLRCAVKIVQTGVREVVYQLAYSMDDRSRTIFQEAGVKIRQFQPM